MIYRLYSSLILILLLLTVACNSQTNEEGSNEPQPVAFEYALILHGGTSSMTSQTMTLERQETYKQSLDRALQLGLEILKEGGTSLDAVEQVIRFLEDDTLFNAGRGAVFTREGKNELDASIMTGWDLNAGAVAGVTDVKNPISAARAVMEKSKHVMLTGQGASLFAKEAGLEIVDPSYFFTKSRFESLQRAQERENHGTVGCVALDQNGNLCAGTSTGGTTNKRAGRIGDSPVIGAGNYANNATCGVSATGDGEFFIRWTIAHDISALMEYKGMGVDEAAKEVLENKLAKTSGKGGVICLDRFGRPGISYITSGMKRAYGNSAGDKVVKIFE